MLIDADNASPVVIAGLLAEVAKYGTARVKRAYGDWTSTSLRGWKEQLLAQSIQPMQQFAYTAGKNATDAAMVIDAMDLDPAAHTMIDAYETDYPVEEDTYGLPGSKGGLSPVVGFTRPVGSQ